MKKRNNRNSFNRGTQRKDWARNGQRRGRPESGNKPAALPRNGPVEWLRADEDADLDETIRHNTRTGRAAGDEAFIARIEKLTGRHLRAKKG